LTEAIDIDPAERAEPAEISHATRELDALAAQLILRAAPVRFRRAVSSAEREAVYQMRYRVVVERGWARVTDFPDGFERDSFDDRAIQVVGLDGNRIVASNRIVLPDSTKPLPTQEAFDIPLEPKGRIVDWSRTIVAGAYSSSSHRVLGGLVGQSWLETRRRGFFHICGTFTQAMIRLYRRMGIHFTVLSAPRRYWNEERVAVRLELIASAQALRARWITENPEAVRI
jgi:N-acyl-L-homoserine lactone synthetase